MCYLEDEEEFEESPAVTMLAQMEKETYQINIGGDKKTQFDVRDEIFQLTAPNMKISEGPSCTSCDKDLSNKKT
jgi:hypothetical protein